MIALTGPVSLSAQEPELGRALALEREGRAAEALAAIELLALRYPQSPWLRFHAGRLLAAQGRFDESIRQLELALELAPRLHLAAAALGAVYQHTGELERARELLGRHLEAAPESDEVRIELVKTLLALGEAQAALEQSDRLMLRRADQPETLLVRGEALLLLRRFDEAAAAARACARRIPDSPLPEILLARVEVARGRGGPALEAAERAAALAPQAGRPHFVAGLAYELLERRLDTIAAYQKALALGADGLELRLRLGEQLTQERRFDEARELLLEAQEKYPEVPALLLALAKAQRALGQSEAARGLLSRALELDSDLPELHFELGLVLEALGELGPAESHFRRALELNPALAPASYRLGSLLRRSGRIEEARALLHTHDQQIRSHEVEADRSLQAQVLTNTASHHLLSGRAAEALSFARRALALRPDQLDARLLEARALLALGRAAESVRVLEALDAGDRETPAVRELLIEAREAAKP